MTTEEEVREAKEYARGVIEYLSRVQADPVAVTRGLALALAGWCVAGGLPYLKAAALLQDEWLRLVGPEALRAEIERALAQGKAALVPSGRAPLGAARPLQRPPGPRRRRG